MAAVARPTLKRYYDSLESRIGYRVLLGGARHFGFYDDEYSWPFSITKALRAMEQVLLDALDLPKGSKVLDCGSGHGQVALYMAQQGGFQMQAIDIVDHHIINARKNVEHAGLTNQVKVQLMDYQDLSSFADNTFDGLYTIETLVHALEAETTLKEFYRVLRPGGVIVHHEYDHKPLNKAPKDLRRSLDIVNKCSDMPSFTAFETDAIGELLSKVGFKEVRTRDLTPNVLPMVFLFWLLAFIPYQLIHLFRLERKFVNTVAGYEMYRGRELWRYVQVKGRKPSVPEQQAVAGAKEQ